MCRMIPPSFDSRSYRYEILAQGIVLNSIIFVSLSVGPKVFSMLSCRLRTCSALRDLLPLALPCHSTKRASYLEWLCIILSPFFQEWIQLLKIIVTLQTFVLVSKSQNMLNGSGIQTQFS